MGHSTPSYLATPIIGRNSPASSNAERATTPSPLLRNSQSIGRSTPQLPAHYLSSLSEGIVYDGNNNGRQRSQTSKRSLKRKRVTYNFEEIDRRSSSTFDPEQLCTPMADRSQMNITLNKAVLGDIDDDDHDLKDIPKSTASVKNVSATNVYMDTKDSTDAVHRTSPMRSSAETNVRNI